MTDSSTINIININRKGLFVIKVDWVINISLKNIFINTLSLIKLLKSRYISTDSNYFLFNLNKNRNGISNKLNLAIFKFVFNSFYWIFNKSKVLWIKDPHFYYLRNFIKWDFLILDYMSIKNLRGHPFYKTVFKKKLVFVYQKEKNNDYQVGWFRKKEMTINENKVRLIVDRFNLDIGFNQNLIEI